MDFSMWIWPYGRWGGLERMALAAQRIEELGFTSITVSDHTACPAGAEGGALGAQWPDWSVLSAALATATRRLRIVSCAVLPYRHPLPMAKQVATLDQLSAGRFTLAACVGWWRHEFEMLNVDYGARGAIFDEHLDAMRVLWTDDAPAFAGRHVAFSDLVFEPRCVQRPHVPVWIAGGPGPRVIDRVCRAGDGWMPMGDDDPDRLGEVIARIRAGAAERGRDPGALTFRYTIGLGEAEPALAGLSTAIASAGGGIAARDVRRTAAFGGDADQVAESIARYAQAGFTELAINPAGRSADECLERIEWFAVEVLPQVAA